MEVFKILVKKSILFFFFFLLLLEKLEIDFQLILKIGLK